MQVTRSALATAAGPSDWFTGGVFLDTIAAPSDGSRLHASNVHFTPGARTAWHTHPNGQTIWVTEGVGHGAAPRRPDRDHPPRRRVFVKRARSTGTARRRRGSWSTSRCSRSTTRATPRRGATTSPTRSTRRRPRSTDTVRRQAQRTLGPALRMLWPSPIAIAAPTSERCVNACGKFPSCGFGHGVVLLGDQPDIVTRSRGARRAHVLVDPALKRSISASQNEQARNTPSPAGSPSNRRGSGSRSAARARRA